MVGAPPGCVVDDRVAARLPLGASEASRLVRTRRALRVEFPAAAAALAAGDLHQSSAEVVLVALHDLDIDTDTDTDPDADADPDTDADADPDAGSEPELSRDLRAAGEQTLIGACATHDPAAVGNSADGWPSCSIRGMQARDEAKLRDHEDTAHGWRGFTMTPDRVKDSRTPGQRRYDAIVDILRHHLHHPTTSSGDGEKAQIRVTIPLTSLTSLTEQPDACSPAQPAPRSRSETAAAGSAAPAPPPGPRSMI